ncbi:MAG: DUF1398 family protein [Bdellovibrionales bacterium]|nr:DUF1398 family protein [Bdellovibrionales bacterium]
MDKKFFEDCAQASLTGSKKFPEVVGSLLAAGVESYHVDLTRCENRYYLPSGESHAVANGLPAIKVANAFSAAQVESAVRESQAGKITYPQFMQKIATAGVVYYITYLAGKRVVYMGRNGDSHTEYFPGSR